MNQQRRTFLKKTGRIVILTGLVGISADLLFRKNEEGQECNTDFICRNCRKNRSCRLPEARSYRQELNTNQKDHGQK